MTLLLTLTACALRPAPRLMLLDAGSEAQVAAVPAIGTPRPVLAVRAVRIPEYLDRRNLVYRASPTELKAFDDAVWAERLDVALTRSFAQRLSLALPRYDVQTYTASADKPVAVALNIDVRAFEAVSPSRLRLQGEWHAAGAVPADGGFTIDENLAALDPDAVVDAMRRALGQAADGIATRIGNS